MFCTNTWNYFCLFFIYFNSFVFRWNISQGTLRTTHCATLVTLDFILFELFRITFILWFHHTLVNSLNSWPLMPELCHLVEHRSHKFFLILANSEWLLLMLFKQPSTILETMFWRLPLIFKWITFMKTPSSRKDVPHHAKVGKLPRLINGSWQQNSSYKD